MRRLARIALAAALAVLGAQAQTRPALAQSGQMGAGETDPGQAAVDKLLGSARERESRAEAARAEAQRIAAELAASEQRVTQISDRIAARQSDARAARGRLAALAAEYAETTARLRTRREEYAAAIGAMAALSKTPAPALFAHAGRPVDAARSGAALEALRDSLVAEARSIAIALQELEVLRDRGQAARAEAESAIEAMRREEVELRKMLAARSQDRESAAEREAALRQEAMALSAQAEQARALLIRAPAPTLRPQRASLAPVEPAPAIRGKINPFAPFRPLSEAYGRMAPPVVGEVALPFGANKPGGGGRTIGLFFSARPFASVYAPWQGRISFADKMDRFGVVVMIDIGEGGQLMLVGLSETDRKAGELVLAGEPVGRLGGPRGRSDDFMSEASAINLGAMSSLYFEFRRNGEPTDPAPWLESGQLR